MNIFELDSFNLADAVKFNDELNPRIWDGMKMRPEVREKLLTIAADFQESLGVSGLDVEDITVSGSNAGFTYTPHSDIDLHLVVRMPEDCDEVYQELFNAKKYQYNDEHDIRIGGYDVELYVQPSDQPHVSSGVYSVKNNDWVHIPRKIAARVDDESVRNKYEDIKARIESALKSNDIDRMRRLWDKIKDMRKSGLAQNGELGPENLAFKMLRTQGDLGQLKDAINRARDAELSLTERRKKKKKSRVKYGFGGYWYPGFNFGSDAGSDSGAGDGGGGESKFGEDVTLTPDGVSPSTKMFLSEKDVPNHTEIIFDFMRFAVHELELHNVPTLKIKKDPQWSVIHKSFGRYRDDLGQIELAVGNRHIMDVLRTLAHELQHRKQDEREHMPPGAGATGSRFENEAHAVAGVLMRKYADLHPEYFEDVPVSESASGYIPTKKEKNDPRYKMALTVDIKPGQVGKEANKMALQTDRQGKPALVYKSVNQLAEEFDQFKKNKSHGYNSQPLSQKPGEQEDDLGNQEATGPEFPPQMPVGTTKIDVDDLTDWYRLGMDISDMDDADPEDYGKGPPQTVVVFPSDEAEQGYLKQFKRLGLKTHDMDPDVKGGEDIYGKHLNKKINEADRRDVLKTMAAGAAAAAVPGLAKAGTFSDVLSMATTDPQQFEKVWVPRYQELTQRCQDMLRKLVAAAGPNWAQRLRGSTVRVVSNQVYAGADSDSKMVSIDLSVFWDAPDSVLAFAIAHELGHIAFGHTGADTSSNDYAKRVQAAKISQQQELDADTFAIQLCKVLGYNRSELFKFISKNEQEYQLFKLMLQSPTDTHPTYKERVERARKNGFELSRGGIQQMQALQQHLAEDALVESLRQEFELLESEVLGEITMSPSNLRKQAAQTGALAGMEFEMIVPDVNIEDDIEPEYERDDSADRRVYSFDDIEEFFLDGDYNGQRDLRRLISSLQEAFMEWKLERIDDDWTSEGQDYVRDYIENNNLFDRDEALNTARDEVISANPDLPPESEDAQQLIANRIDELEEQFVEQEFENQGPIYNDAYEQFTDEKNQDYDESDFFEENFPRMSDIADNYDIQWPYWVDINADRERSPDIDSVAEDFSEAIGRPVNTSQRYSMGIRQPGKYVVEPDGSLSPDDYNDMGLEFVSPPLPIDEMLSDLEKVRAWAKERGCYTNNSTGLHINISVPNFDVAKLDYVKLALLLGDKYVLDQFGRSSNTYTRSALGKVENMVRQNPQVAQALLDKMRGHMEDLATKAVHSGETEKYTSINTKQNRIEFRSPGGDWLNADIGKIENTLLRFTVALSAAMNPEAYREEYLKKLYKLLAPTADTGGNKDTVKYFADYVAGNIPKAALRSFVKQAQLERKIKSGQLGGKFKWEVERPGYAASIIVVAKTKEEAIDRALQPDAYPDWANARNQLTATPIGPADVSLGGRPSNPDGNWVISPENDRSVVAYRFRAADKDDAAIVAQQWRQANPGRVWIVQRDDNRTLGQPAIPGSTIDRQRQSAAAAQQPSQNTGDPGSLIDQGLAASGNFTGNWLIQDPEGRTLHRFGGVGNSQGDANNFALRWLRSNPQHIYTGVEVVPELR